jgi:tetratricopeptide (TPR) repeat protein
MGGKRLWIAIVLLLVLGATIYWFLHRGKDAENHLESAQRALDNREFRQARIHLLKHLEKNPEDLSARLLAARAARRNRNFREAVEDWRLYQQHGGSRDTLLTEQELARIQEGDLRKAPIVLEFCREHQTAPETHLMLEALIEGTLKRLDTPPDAPSAPGAQNAPPDINAALWAVDWWLENRPQVADQCQGFLWRGRLCLKEERHEEAVVNLRKAVELEPRQMQARFLLAQEVFQASPKEAVTHLRLLHQDAPDDVWIHFKLANSLRILGQLDEARQLFNELLAKEPNNFPALVERGNVALDSLDSKEAEGWLRRAERLAPNNLELLISLNRCLRLEGKPEEAQHYLDRFQKLVEEKRQQETALMKNNKPVIKK